MPPSIFNQDQMQTPSIFQPVTPDAGMVQAASPVSTSIFNTPKPMPSVFKPLQDQEDYAQQKLQKDQWKDQNPWGTANNHPGVFGKIAHGLSLAGNIAGDIFAPAVMANVPGTDAHRQVEEGNLERSIQGLEHQKVANAKEQADADREQQDQQFAAEQEPGKLQSQEDTSEHTQAETKKLGQPTWQALKTDQGMFAHNPATNELTPLTYQGQPLTQNPKPEKPDTPEQQYIDEDQKLHPKDTIAQAEHKYAVDTKIQQPPQVMMFVPGANGSSTAQLVHPGQTIAPGAQTAAGLNSVNTPTTQQRTASGRADIVLQSIPDVLNDLHQNAAQLGPGMGRFNDIYSGKIGAPNPQFAGLMADLKLMGTAVALAHAQGRMSNELLNEFNSMIAAPQQSPQNIEAVLGKVQHYMQNQSQQGKGPSQRTAQPNQGPALGTVEGGYRFKGGNPSDQASWEKVK